MRLVLVVLATMMVPSGVVLAQGTKDPANYGTVSAPKAQPAVAPASRPTVTRNTPDNLLPPGTAIQRTFRDGKLQSFVR
jgi:hypothetical protein